jgi:hypothetical protein
MGARLDLTTVVGYGNKESGVSLVMGVSSWEDPTLKDAAQFVNLTKSNTWSSGPQIKRGENATGPLTLGDVDGDGPGRSSADARGLVVTRKQRTRC